MRKSCHLFRIETLVQLDKHRWYELVREAIKTKYYKLTSESMLQTDDFLFHFPEGEISEAFANIICYHNQFVIASASSKVDDFRGAENTTLPIH